MKLTLSIVLLFVLTNLFAQNDTPVKGIPVKVGKDGKVIVGIKPVVAKVDSNRKMTLKVDTSKIGGFVSMTDVFKEKTFWEKCTYWFFWLKKEQPYMFWPLLVIICFWFIKLVFKLFDR